MCDYIKPKYGKNAKLCYTVTDSFFVHMKTDDIYKDIEENAEKIFDTSNYEIGRTLPKGKNNGLMKDELGGQIMKEFVGLRAKTYSYLIDDGCENKKSKGTKKYVIKRELKFQDHKNFLNTAKVDRKLKHLEKKCR